MSRTLLPASQLSAPELALQSMFSALLEKFDQRIIVQDLLQFLQYYKSSYPAYEEAVQSVHLFAAGDSPYLDPAHNNIWTKFAEIKSNTHPPIIRTTLDTPVVAVGCFGRVRD